MSESPLVGQQTRVTALLRDIGLFRSLDLHSIGHISSSLRPFSLTTGEILIERGVTPRELYIVAEGRLGVLSTDSDGVEFHLGEIATGETVGEKALLRNEPWNEDVRALVPVSGYALSKQNFMDILNLHPEEMKIVTDLISKRDKGAADDIYRPGKEELRGILKEIELFSSLNDEILEELEPYFQWMPVHKGEVIMNQGDSGSQLYVLISGRLSFQVRGDSGNILREGSIEVGDVVGETSLLTEEPRSATVFAARDSRLLTLAPYALARLVRNNPRVLLELARILAKRLSGGSDTRRNSDLRVISLIPLQRDIDVREFAENLKKNLSSNMPVQLFTYRDDTPELPRRVDKALAAGTLPLILGIPGEKNWNEKVCRHGERILLLSNPSSHDNQSWDDPISGVEQVHRQTALASPVFDLVFLHRGSITSAAVQTGLQNLRSSNHHQVRQDSSSDYARLGRFLTGSAVGLALGGGGARGLAHIGVVQALREAGIPVDLVAGTSIGALVGAAVAMEQSIDEMKKAAWRHLVSEKPFRDPALPLVSLLRGKKITSGIKRYFGDQIIEDLPLRYSAVTTDLEGRELHIMKRGPLWKAIRSSLAVPGLIPPVYESGRLLADGGLLNNAPADVAISMGASRTLLIDVSGARDPDPEGLEGLFRNIPTGHAPEAFNFLFNRLRSRRRWSGIGEVIMKSLLLGSHRSSVENARIADCGLTLPVSEFGLLDFASLDRLVEIGYRSALENVDNWKTTLG